MLPLKISEDAWSIECQSLFFFPVIGRKYSICANKVIFVILSSFPQYMDTHVHFI